MSWEGWQLTKCLKEWTPVTSLLPTLTSLLRSLWWGARPSSYTPTAASLPLLTPGQWPRGALGLRLLSQISTNLVASNKRKCILLLFWGPEL